MKRALAVLTAPALIAALGCSVPLSNDKPYSTNICASDSDCPDGAACASLDGEALCVARSVDLPEVLFEVSPVLNGDVVIPSLVGPVDVTSMAGPYAIDLPLAAPQYVDVSPGRVYLPCAGEVPVPARVQLIPYSKYSGLLQQRVYDAEPTVDAAGGEAFHVSVPPGTYSVYIQPQPDLVITPDCAGAPPVFAPLVTIDKAAAFTFHAGDIYTAQGTLKLSQKEDFTKWYLEIVEPITGRIISDVIQPEQMGLDLEVPFAIRFDWSSRGQETQIMPFIRLRPPEGSGKPTIHWSLAASASGKEVDRVIPVKLDLSSVDTQSRKVEGRVIHDTKSVPSTGTIRSIGGPGGELVRFETVLETDAQGHFEALVPRREYIVIARPYSDDYAFGTAAWDVQAGDECYCGNAIEVPSAATLSGAVYGAAGEIVDAEVRVTPTASASQSYLGNMLASDVQPRSASATTDNGQYKLHVDGGTFDLSIVPQSPGYPWLVRPRQIIGSPMADSAPVLNLETMRFQSPAVLRGLASGADGAPLPGATIRAWIGVSDPQDPTVSPSAVQIGEAVADNQGNYVLLLPPSIKQGN